MITPPTAYDRAITIFSPEGKLYQVEYAFEAVKKGWTSLGLRTKDAVVLAAEKKKVTPLIDLTGIDKIYKVDDHVGVTFAGMASDGRILVDYARIVAARHRLVYGEPATLEYIVRAVCDVKQAYTQHGGVRPFGVSLIFGGVDNGTTRLYRTEPGGQYFSFYATAIGYGGDVVEGIFEKKYRYEMSLEEALELVVEALLQVQGKAGGEGGRDKGEYMIDIGYLTIDKPVFRIMSPDEVAEIVKKVKKRMS